MNNTGRPITHNRRNTGRPNIGRRNIGVGERRPIAERILETIIDIGNRSGELRQVEHGLTKITFASNPQPEIT